MSYYTYYFTTVTILRSLYYVYVIMLIEKLLLLIIFKKEHLWVQKYFKTHLKKFKMIIMGLILVQNCITIMLS